ncbi:MAG TPA: hypothetical protein VIA06_05315 [Candidatus Dormibacteraeota bacterium]|jgi:hypothetical protein|nr:hypothetical protein [Candidatus Dormibacteraeota bacterium]
MSLWRELMDYQLEVLALRAGDAYRTPRFHTEVTGFGLDVDYHPAPDFRVVQLTPRGVDIRHKSPVDTWQGGRRPDVDPEHHDHARFAEFSDPDGNVRVLPDRGHRLRGGRVPIVSDVNERRD